MKGHMNLQSYYFNKPFLLYQKQNFVEAFFQDEIVSSTLCVMTPDGSWSPSGMKATSVVAECIPCTETTMSMFDCLKDPANGIARENGNIQQCLFNDINGFTITDELRAMLLDPDSENYDLIPTLKRNEFLFRLFKHLCLGGQWCQYEENVNPYLNTTKTLYKDIVKVQKDPVTKAITITSVVLKVVAKGRDNIAYCPTDPENEQNFAYLIIDPINRLITTLIHQYGGKFQC